MATRKLDRRTIARTKICKICGKRKPVEAFYLTSYARKHGTKSRMPYCKPCYSKRGKAYYANHTEAMNARSRASVERRRQEDPEGFRRSRANAYLKNVYGITLERWEELYQQQRGRCAICRSRFTLKLSGARADCGVDHDHKCCPGTHSCGKCVRALLCLKCNWGIGQFDDDINKLKRAIQYLNKFAV